MQQKQFQPTIELEKEQFQTLEQNMLCMFVRGDLEFTFIEAERKF